MKVSLNKAAKVLSLPKDVLKRDIRSGKLLMGDGFLDTEDLKRVYPDQYTRACDSGLELYTAIKETAGDWKDGKRQKMAEQSKSQLVNRIRRLEAENYALQKRLAKYEDPYQN